MVINKKKLWLILVIYWIAGVVFFISGGINHVLFVKGIMLTIALVIPTIVAVMLSLGRRVWSFIINTNVYAFYFFIIIVIGSAYSAHTWWIAAFLIGLALVLFLILLALAAILALIKTLFKKKNGQYYFVKTKRTTIGNNDWPRTQRQIVEQKEYASFAPCFRRYLKEALDILIPAFLNNLWLLS